MPRRSGGARGRFPGAARAQAAPLHEPERRQAPPFGGMSGGRAFQIGPAHEGGGPGRGNPPDVEVFRLGNSGTIVSLWHFCISFSDAYTEGRGGAAWRRSRPAAQRAPTRRSESRTAGIPDYVIRLLALVRYRSRILQRAAHGRPSRSNLKPDMPAERGSWSVYLLCWKRYGGLQYIGISQDVDRRINAHRKAGRLPFAQLGGPAIEVLHFGLDVYAACEGRTPRDHGTPDDDAARL